jgi:dTDP-4-amino-4,6-dideoxygalactose transaminase
MNPFGIIEQFEVAICNYTGAPYAVAVNSCTNALFLAVRYWREHMCADVPVICVPKRTYVSVPMAIKHAGCEVVFADRDWEGTYCLHLAPIWDCARRFTGGMFKPEISANGASPLFQCVSFHWTKPLGIQHGGAILHNSHAADEWLRRARFDGRLPGEDAGKAKMIGWHCLTTPEVAAAGLVRIANLPTFNPDAPKPAYPDLSTMEIFK